MGVQRANPNEYVARYGAQLEDSQSLVTHARQAGVVEDIVSLFQFSSRSIIFPFRHLLLVQQQVFNHPVLKVINPVVAVLVVLAMMLVRPQPVVMMLVVVFLQVEVPELI